MCEIHEYAAEIAVTHTGDFYEVYVDPGYFAEVVGREDVADAIEHGVDVYNRRTGELVTDVSEL
jgi:hypothetical protein